MLTMDLTDDEIDAICAGYRQNAAKVRFLMKLGLTVRKKPNGRPLVNRNHYDTVMGCGPLSMGAKFDLQPIWGVH